MNGPNNVKPKGTWTHINRMDLGSGGCNKASMLPGLGKRDSREALEGHVDEQNCKKGKLNSDEESVGAFSGRIGLPPAIMGWTASCDGGP